MSFARSGGLYDAPFPSDDLRRGGIIDISAFPNPRSVGIVRQSRDLITRDYVGFALTGGIFFQVSAGLDPARLPAIGDTAQAGAPVFLIGVDPQAPDYRRRYPVEVAFVSDGGPFGAPNLLSLLPLQGIPLRPRTLYAAVVLRRLGDAQGQPLGVSPSMSALAAGNRPAGLSPEAFASYQQALAALREAGVAASDIAGLAAFTTGDPTADMALFRTDVLSRPLPMPGPWQRQEVFDDYCVYSTTMGMPDYQQGTPPFTNAGGDWMVDAAHRPVLQRVEEANVVVTVPRRELPQNGFPIVVFVRAGGGGDRPLVDRGTQPMPGADALVPGTGPAMYFARAGFAGISVDGPLGGRRNPTPMVDENTLLWNLTNGAALRDNVRQNALELILVANLLPSLTLDTSDCPGGPATVSFDLAHLAVMGHSNGSTIAPLALSYEPRFRAAILSGAGGSWIENVVYKQKPLPIRPLAEIVLGYAANTLSAHDPVLTLVQWAAEPADPQVYDRRVLREPATDATPRHVLMFQGIVDHYILPRIANTTSLSLGLDLAGEPLDTEPLPDLVGQTPLASVLQFSGGANIDLPASGNRPGGVTAVVVQHPSDGIEDGHEVVFQTDPPKHQYRCFLESFARGTPVVPVGAGADAPCP
jgi:hypothetical protein